MRRTSLSSFYVGETHAIGGYFLSCDKHTTGLLAFYWKHMRNFSFHLPVSLKRLWETPERQLYFSLTARLTAHLIKKTISRHKRFSFFVFEGFIEGLISMRCIGSLFHTSIIATVGCGPLPPHTTTQLQLFGQLLDKLTVSLLVLPQYTVLPMEESSPESPPNNGWENRSSRRLLDILVRIE